MPENEPVKESFIEKHGLAIIVGGTVATLAAVTLVYYNHTKTTQLNYAQYLTKQNETYAAHLEGLLGKILTKASDAAEK
jgi:hypothetical protein